MGSSWSSSGIFAGMSRRRALALTKAQRLYRSGDIDEAIKIWTKLSSERHVPDGDKLTTFGWLAIACFTTGHFREMATWSARQLRLARQIYRDPMPTPTSTALVEALLNVARSELGQGNLARAAFFSAEALIAAGESADSHVGNNSNHQASSSSASSANHRDRIQLTPVFATDNGANDDQNASIANDCRRLSGYCHLVAAHASFGEGNISSGLEHLDRALLVARQYNDQLLELFVQMALAQLFMTLKDYNRALHYCGRCEAMARTLQPAQSPDITACRRLISLYYATIMRKLGRPDYAETIVQELLGDSNCTRDPSFQANCFLLLGDLARSEGQALRAYSLYENAYSLMRQSGSRFGELTVLLQLAKCLLRMRDSGTVCECKAVEVLQRCCLFARSSNANMIRVRSLRFLERVFTLLGDKKAASVTSDELSRLRTSIGLLCAVCRQPIGDRQSAVSILPCAHLAHDQCLLAIQNSDDTAAADLATARPCHSASNTLNRNTATNSISSRQAIFSSDDNNSQQRQYDDSNNNNNFSPQYRSNSYQNLPIIPQNQSNDPAQRSRPEMLKCVHCSAEQQHKQHQQTTATIGTSFTQPNIQLQNSCQQPCCSSINTRSGHMSGSVGFLNKTPAEEACAMAGCGGVAAVDHHSHHHHQSAHLHHNNNNNNHPPVTPSLSSFGYSSATLPMQSSLASQYRGVLV